MSISDKLTAIATNEKRVFGAGKRAVLRDSKYMNARLSGSVVALNDVSPVEHDVAVTLSRESVTDFSGVNVKRYGKNLFENDTGKLGEVNYLKDAGGEQRARIGYAFYLPAGTYTQRAIEKESGNYANCFIYTTAMSLDGRFLFSSANTHLVANETPKISTFTVNEDCIYYVYNAATNLNVTISKSLFERFQFQIERGDAATAYEPYVEPTTYTPNADGTLMMPSLSPSMTLFTDTDGVNIDCTYLRDIDTYIDRLAMNVALTGGD